MVFDNVVILAADDADARLDATVVVVDVTVANDGDAVAIVDFGSSCRSVNCGFPR